MIKSTALGGALKHLGIWGLIGAGSLLTATRAEACGGLFCSRANPVNQTAERIVFADNADGTITTIVEIQYQGPSEHFAWLLPIPGVPDVGVSSNVVLDALDSSTAPRYQLTYNLGLCADYEYADFDAGAVADGGIAYPESEASGIDVLDRGVAGPYDYVVISADPQLDDPAQVAVDWLDTEGYDVGDLGPDVLRPYLAEGMNLVAFRLLKGQDTGAIRPVQLTYEADKPSIPLRPTAVAAAEDMGIYVYLMGDGRGVSDNYLSLELNESRINWFNWRSNYRQVVSEAADAAGGQGFVTEFSGDAKRLKGKLYSDYTRSNWETLTQSSETGVALMMQARWPFGTYEGYRRAVEVATTLPDGLSLDQFASSPYTYEDEVMIDDEAFISELKQGIIDPLQAAQNMVDQHPKLTRLFTTISPLEMTADPAFSFNPKLADVSNVHEAQLDYLCESSDIGYWDAPWRITLPDGNMLYGESDGDWNPSTEELPAATRILQMSEGGMMEMVVEDNTDLIAQQLMQMAEDAPASAKAPTTVDPNAHKTGSDEQSNADAGVSSQSSTSKAKDDEKTGRNSDAGSSSNRISEKKSDDGGCSVSSRSGSSRNGLGGAGLGLMLLSLTLFRRQRRQRLAS